MTTTEKVELLRKAFPNCTFSWEEVQIGERTYATELVITFRPGILCSHEIKGTEWSDDQCVVCGEVKA